METTKAVTCTGTFCHIMDQHDKVCLCVLMASGKWWKRWKLPDFFRDGWPLIYKTAHSVMIDFCCVVNETSLCLILWVWFRRHRPNILVPLGGQVVDLGPPLFHFLLTAHKYNENYHKCSFLLLIFEDWKNFIVILNTYFNTNFFINFIQLNIIPTQLC